MNGNQTQSRVSRAGSISRMILVLGFIFITATLTVAANTPSTINTHNLGGPDRYLAYLNTDKPIYREGEPVFLRTVILNARDNTPLQKNTTRLAIQITGPNDVIVHKGYANDSQSVIGYRWDIPEGLPGGQYTVKVTSPTLGIPEAQRNFDIRAYRPPRLKTQIDFTRDGYGPGDRVNASMTVERAEGGIPAGAAVTVVARIDSNEVFRSSLPAIDSTGLVSASFQLPARIDTGNASLVFLIEDGGIVETASKTLPIILRKLDITFYPEGGELVAALENRLYFQALLPNGKPADIKGYIVEYNNNTAGIESIANFDSTHEGRGRFNLKVKANTQYAAVITHPSGITEPVMLPAVKRDGTILKSTQETYAYKNRIKVSVASAGASYPATLTLHKRESLLDTRVLNSEPSTSPLELDAKDAEGVLIATVWDKAGRPLAERLIYRQPRFGLNVDLQLTDTSFTPGESVTVDIITTDKAGNPVEAVVGLTVTDDSVLELIEKREQAPRLPVMVYLENEVRDLADADVYLDSDNVIAHTATDLLLGTQGWRRFVLVNYDELKDNQPAYAARIMAQRTIIKPAPVVFRRAMQANVAEVMAEAVQKNNLDNENDIQEEKIDVPVIIEPALNKENRPTPPQDAANALLGARPEAGLIIAEADMAVNADLVFPMEKHLRSAYIREFAFKVRDKRQPNDRSDFTETLYWSSGIKTSARDGKATVSFDLSDSVTTFRLMADAFGRNGALGTGDERFTSVEPFYITAKMPLHAVTGDVIELPVTLVNTTSKLLKDARLQIKGEGITTIDLDPVTLNANQRFRKIVTIHASRTGTFPISVSAKAGPFTDKITRNLVVNAAGFPVSINEGGLLSKETTANVSITLPPNIKAGSLIANARIYPSPLASMEEALNALLREPHGCFEQTSSTNYPLVMAQQYFDTHTGVDPKKIATAKQLLKVGYKKLTAFESADNGYEWFGANPAHEALTAYGLMEFSDMSKVMQVEPAMLERTRQWLLSRRDGKGGFKRNDRALDSFGRAPAATTDAYIVWSLLESGQSPATLQKEIAQVRKNALASNDSYIDALAANILYLTGDNNTAEILSQQLVDATDQAGAVGGAATSITRSGGDSLLIETTSLALLAWLRDDSTWVAPIETSIKWLFERSKAGRFGSTQSTVLALKAINAYDAARAVPKAPGSVQLYVNNVQHGVAVKFTTDSKGAITLPDFSLALTNGEENTIELRMVDGSKMPYALDITYNTSKPDNGDTTPVSVATLLSHSKITEGEPLDISVTINTSDEVVPTPIAIIGIPAGTELRHDQLKELQHSDKFSAYEIRNSELVLYWRALKANETRHLTIDLIATVPGSYHAPASRIYPYYTAENKYWVAGHSVLITAK